MTKRITPITIFCEDPAHEAWLADDPDSRVMRTGPGTLSFHKLIAEHGAGIFKTLYVPLSLKGTFSPPAGGEVRNAS